MGSVAAKYNVSDKTGLEALRSAEPERCRYLGIFLFAEGAFVVMALKEYA